jgi:macrolide-specific efflux system membrane fusion protein
MANDRVNPAEEPRQTEGEILNPAVETPEPDAPWTGLRMGPVKLSPRWLAATTIVAVLVAVYVWRAPGQDQTVRPLLVPASVGDIESVVTAAGTLQAGAYVDVGAQVSGQLQKMHVQVGQTVEEGALLAEIDARVQVNRVEASRANLKADEAQMSARRAALELAQANVTRQRELMRENLTTQEQVDNAINNLAAAESSLVELESRIERSKAGLASDETQLGYSKIYAPTSGTVVSISITEGQTLNASQLVPTILRIADLDVMTVKADVSEADVSRIGEGTDVYFTTLGGGERRWYGQVKQILPTPTVVDNVVSYPVLFDVGNEDRTLLPGMTTQAFFIIAAVRDVLTIPLGAVTFDPGTPSETGRRRATVRVMLEDGTIETRAIEVGMTNRISAEVTSGLTAGEKVVAGIREPARASGR